MLPKKSFYTNDRPIPGVVVRRLQNFIDPGQEKYVQIWVK